MLLQLLSVYSTRRRLRSAETPTEDDASSRLVNTESRRPSASLAVSCECCTFLEHYIFRLL